MFDSVQDSGCKPTNPKDQISVEKIPFSLIPSNVLAEVALAFLEGSLKYGSYNWRVAGVRASVYLDAESRHKEAFKNGEDIDPDSGLNHIAKAIACLIILRDSMLNGNWTDDRPPKINSGWIQESNKKVKELIAKYPNPKSPYTELNKNEEKNNICPVVEKIMSNLQEKRIETNVDTD